MSMPASAMAASSFFLRSSWIMGSLGSFLGSDTIIPRRRLLRHDTFGEVARNIGRRTLLRIAIAPATGGEEDDSVAGGEQNLGGLQDLLLGAIGTTDDGGIGGSRLTAMQ